MVRNPLPFPKTGDGLAFTVDFDQKAFEWSSITVELFHKLRNYTSLLGNTMELIK